MAPRTYTTEKDVKAEVKKLLNKHGWFWWMPSGNGFGRAGVADFNAIKDGVFLAIETKFGKNKPKHMQSAYLTSIAAESGFGFVVNEKNVQTLGLWLMHFADATDTVRRGEKVRAEDGAAMLDAIAILTDMIDIPRARGDDGTPTDDA